MPGAPGIGIKTAAALIQEYGDLDTLLARAGEIKQPKRREVLTGHADQIRISRDLVTLRRDVVLEEPLTALEVREPDGDVLLPWLGAHGVPRAVRAGGGGARGRRAGDRAGERGDGCRRSPGASRRRSRRSIMRAT